MSAVIPNILLRIHDLFASKCIHLAGFGYHGHLRGRHTFLDASCVLRAGCMMHVVMGVPHMHVHLIMWLSSTVRMVYDHMGSTKHDRV